MSWAMSWNNRRLQEQMLEAFHPHLVLQAVPTIPRVMLHSQGDTVILTIGEHSKRRERILHLNLRMLLNL